MRLLMGISKNRHGTYYAIKKVPVHLQEPMARVLDNGKARQTWLKRSLGTKDPNGANRRVKPVQIEFDRLLDQARELLAERPLRDRLSEIEIKRMADHHYAERLHVDDLRTREGTGRDAFNQSIAKQLKDAGVEYETPVPLSGHPPAFGLSEGDVARRAADLEFEMPIMRTALSTGDIAKVGEYLEYELDLFGINLDRKSEAYRHLEWPSCESTLRPLKQLSSEPKDNRLTARHCHKWRQRQRPQVRR
jgi:hypothetical protein